jgi:hypothetical protein
MAIFKICLSEESSEEWVKEFMSVVLNDAFRFKYFNFRFSAYHKLPEKRDEANEAAYHTLGVQLYNEFKRAFPGY